MSDVVYYELDTLVGKQEFPVPDYLKLDKTGKICWMHLLYSVKEWDKLRQSEHLTRKETKKRDRLSEKTDILSNVLARTYGMASTYYVLEARRMQEHWL